MNRTYVIARWNAPSLAQRVLSSDDVSSRRHWTDGVRHITSLQAGGESDVQIGKPLCELWRKVWSRLLSLLGPALLPQGVQSQLSRQECQGPRPHAQVVRLVAARANKGKITARRSVRRVRKPRPSPGCSVGSSRLHFSEKIRKVSRSAAERTST